MDIDKEIQAWLDDMDDENERWKAQVVFMISSKSALHDFDWGLDKEGDKVASVSAVGRTMRAS